MSGDNY